MLRKPTKKKFTIHTALATRETPTARNKWISVRVSAFGARRRRPIQLDSHRGKLAPLAVCCARERNNFDARVYIRAAFSISPWGLLRAPCFFLRFFLPSTAAALVQLRDGVAAGRIKGCWQMDKWNFCANRERGKESKWMEESRVIGLFSFRWLGALENLIYSVLTAANWQIFGSENIDWWLKCIGDYLKFVYSIVS